MWLRCVKVCFLQLRVTTKCREVAPGGTGTFASVLTAWAAIQTLPLEPKEEWGQGQRVPSSRAYPTMAQTAGGKLQKGSLSVSSSLKSG